MDIDKGFKMDKPDLFIPWDIYEGELMGLFLFNDYEMISVDDGYCTASTESLGGLKSETAFLFGQGPLGKLKQFEFYRSRDSDIDLAKSYHEFQEFFTKQFGRPTETSIGQDFNHHYWDLKGAYIEHCVCNHNFFGRIDRVLVRKGERRKDGLSPG